MEERMEKIKENNTEKRHSQKRAGGYAIRFFGCWLLTVALAVGMFLFWIYLSFEMRLSAEVIRAGLMVLYILPCFLGARMVRRSCLPWKIFWGAFLGIAYYALLFVLSFLQCVYSLYICAKLSFFFLHNQDKNRQHYYIVSRLFR